ncbi:MAG TPA: hypothetical protein VFW90_01870 [Candidatus Saccharimonadales bacterium]|nr:hypothetical protein [Candidatus Saccharimonadales bacterium]
MKSGLLAKYKIYLAVAVLIILVLIGFFVLSGYSFTSDDNSQTSDSSQSASQGSNGQNTLAIKELGVKITLRDALAGTTYKVAKPSVAKNSKFTIPPMVNLELNQYTELVAKCLGIKGIATFPYATLSKVSGRAPSTDKNVLKQFDTFYIDELVSGANPKCKTNQTDQQAIDSLEKSLNDGLKTAFANAQQL